MRTITLVQAAYQRHRRCGDVHYVSCVKVTNVTSHQHVMYHKAREEE